MRTRILVIGLLLAALSAPFVAPVSGQQAANFTLSVLPDSTFLRAEPLPDAPPVASVFENDALVAIGRSADGTWLEVRRPGRPNTRLGWILREFVAYTFDVGLLPLTNTTAGVTGPTPLSDTGIAAQVLSEANLRDRPNGSQRLGIVPVFVTLPVVGRSADNLWFEVNYLGTVGWISEFLLRLTGDLNSVPVTAGSASGLPEGGLPIVPPEVQRAQVARLREYILPLREAAFALGGYWQMLLRGEAIPCTPPAAVAMYPYTQQDIRELPELRRYIRRLERAISDMNASIATAQPCGVFTPVQIRDAYAQTVNAVGLFDAVLDNLEFVEENIIPD